MSLVRIQYQGRLRFHEKHVHTRTLRALKRGLLSPWQLSWFDLKSGTSAKVLHQYSAGWPVTLIYEGKEYLIQFNRVIPK